MYIIISPPVKIIVTTKMVILAQFLKESTKKVQGHIINL